MARGDQLSRQWKIIQSLMAARKGKSATELSDALECHSRTVYRDLEALQMAGFPLYTEKSEGRTLKPVMLGGKCPLSGTFAHAPAVMYSLLILKCGRLWLLVSYRPGWISIILIRTPSSLEDLTFTAHLLLRHSDG